MKTTLLTIGLLAACSALAQPAAPSAGAHPSPYNFPGHRYPEIEPDARVAFQFTAPAAQSVQVTVNNAPFDMVKGSDGVWTYTTAQPQAPGYHNYWMVVDGALVLDPNVEGFIGYSHLCNGFEVPDPGVTFYDIKNVPHGNVEIKNYYATTSNSWRHIYVYTPPGYEANRSARYPVLYLQHGGGEDERVWTQMGRVNVILDNLLAEGKVKPMIVAMESSAVGTPPAGFGGGRRGGGGGAPGAGGPGGGGFGGAPGGAAPGGAPRGGGAPGGRGGFGGFGFAGFEHLLLTDEIPYIDANFRTIADQLHRAMAGLSMGGMQTHNITMAHLDTFSHIGIFSGGSIATTEITNLTAFKKQVKVVFFSFGSLEPGAPGAKTAADALKQEGVNAYYFESPGTAHEWQTWRRSLHEFAPLLFQDSTSSSAPNRRSR